MKQLSEKNDFVNYRDSKLTRILSNSLGGNAQTYIICNITLGSIEDTMSALMFAQRAKNVKNKPKINEIVSDESLAKKLMRESAKLEKDLDEVTRQNEQLKLEQDENNRKIKALLDDKEARDKMFVRKTEPHHPKRRHTFCLGTILEETEPGSSNVNLLNNEKFSKSEGSTTPVKVLKEKLVAVTGELTELQEFTKYEKEFQSPKIVKGEFKIEELSKLHEQEQQLIDNIKLLEEKTHRLQKIYGNLIVGVQLSGMQEKEQLLIDNIKILEEKNDRLQNLNEKLITNVNMKDVLTQAYKLEELLGTHSTGQSSICMDDSNVKLDQLSIASIDTIFYEELDETVQNSSDKSANSSQELSWTTKFNKLQSLHENTKQLNGELLKNKTDLDDKIFTLQEELTSLKSKVEGLQVTNKSLTISNSQLTNQNVQYEIQINNLRSKVKDLQSSNENLNSIDDQLTDQNVHYKIQISTLENKLEELLTTNKNLTKINDQLKNENENKVNKIGKTDKDLQLRNVQMSNLENKVQDLETTTDQLTRRNDQLTNENSQCEIQIQNLKLNLTDLKSANENYTRKNDQLTCRNGEYKIKIDALKKNVEDLRKTANENLTKKDDQSIEQNIQISNLENKVQYLEKTTEQLTRRNDQLTNENSQCEIQIHNLKLNVTDLKTANENYTRMNDQLTCRNSEYKIKIDALEKNVEDLLKRANENLTQENDQSTVHKIQISKLENQVKELQLANENLFKNNEKLTDQNVQCKFEINELNSLNQERNKKLERMQNELDTLTRIKTELIETMDHCQQTIKWDHKAFEKGKLDYENKIYHLNQIIEGYKKSLDTQERSVQSLATHEKEHQKIKEHLERMNQQISNKLDSLFAKFNDKMNKEYKGDVVAKLELLFTCFENKIESLSLNTEVEKEELRLKLKNLTLENVALSSKLNSLMKNISQLEEEKKIRESSNKILAVNTNDNKDPNEKGIATRKMEDNSETSHIDCKAKLFACQSGKVYLEQENRLLSKEAGEYRSKIANLTLEMKDLEKTISNLKCEVNSNQDVTPSERAKYETKIARLQDCNNQLNTQFKKLDMKHIQMKNDHAQKMTVKDTRIKKLEAAIVETTNKCEVEIKDLQCEIKDLRELKAASAEDVWRYKNLELEVDELKRTVANLQEQKQKWLHQQMFQREKQMDNDDDDDDVFCLPGFSILKTHNTLVLPESKRMSDKWKLQRSKEHDSRRHIDLDNGSNVSTECNNCNKLKEEVKLISEDLKNTIGTNHKECEVKYILLREKYDILKRVCIMRNNQIDELKAKLSN